VTLRQPFLQRGRQKEDLVRIVGLVVHAHGLTPCFSFILHGIKGLWEEEYSDRLLGKGVSEKVVVIRLVP
jgi:hypothetical protein